MPKRRRYSRTSREMSIGEVIASLIFLAILGGQGFLSQLSPEWKTFLVCSTALTLMVGIAFVGLLIWRRYKLSHTQQPPTFSGAPIQSRSPSNTQPLQPAPNQPDAPKNRATQIVHIQSLAPLALEEYTAHLFKEMGYQATLTPKYGDHGIDVQLVNPRGEKEVAQCKQWGKRNNGLVGEPEIRDFYGAMVSENAVLGYVIAPHGFTQEALRWATGKPLVLADAHWLYLKSNRLDLDFEGAVAVEITSRQAQAQTTNTPHCDRCGAPLVVKKAKKGRHAGKLFWACPNYPQCSAFILYDELPR